MNQLPDGPDARVTYTVKEILLRMEANADERHRDLRKRIDHLHSRVDELEAERDRRDNLSNLASKVGAAIVSLLIAATAIPAAIYYLRGL